MLHKNDSCMVSFPIFIPFLFFSDWLLSLNNMHLSFLHAFWWLDSAFLFSAKYYSLKGFPGGSDGNESAYSSGDLGWEDFLEKGMETHSSILAWRILLTQEPGGLQSTGSQRVRHDWVTKHSTHYSIILNCGWTTIYLSIHLLKDI